MIPFFCVSKIEGIKQMIQTENKQPIKEITHQDIFYSSDLCHDEGKIRL
jgi:hypothetical protein